MLIINKEYSGLNKTININMFNKKWELNSQYNINCLLKMHDIEKIINIREKYKQLISTLSINDQDINFQYLLGSKEYNKIVLDIREKLSKLNNIINKNYVKVIEKRIEFTGKFTDSLYNGKIVKPSLYDHMTSKTGRVKVYGSELNYLTLKKENRKKIESQFVNGKIFVIDIVSLEPRILLHINGVTDIHDIYRHLGDILGLASTRKQIKLGIISTIYGGNVNTVKKISGLEYSDIKKIRNYFKVDELHNEFTTHDVISNYYGRPLKVSDAIVNHFIQSSSADCACLAFNNLMDKWSNDRINFLAFIHDAVIVDVHPSAFDKLKKLNSIYEAYLDITLPVKIEEIK